MQRLKNKHCVFLWCLPSHCRFEFAVLTIWKLSLSSRVWDLQIKCAAISWTGWLGYGFIIQAERILSGSAPAWRMAQAANWDSAAVCQPLARTWPFPGKPVILCCCLQNTKGYLTQEDLVCISKTPYPYNNMSAFALLTIPLTLTFVPSDFCSLNLPSLKTMDSN